MVACDHLSTSDPKHPVEVIRPKYDERVYMEHLSDSRRRDDVWFYEQPV